MTEITLIYPDDWHCHFRDQAYLSRTVNDMSKRFKRAIVMPNLLPPITHVEQAAAYQHRILKALAPSQTLHPLMTLYLSETMTPADIHTSKASGIIHAYKLYPAHATTHSDAGISSITAIYPLLEAMQACDLPLLVHGEVTHHHVDIIKREESFIETQLIPLLQHFPDLRVVLEHISTKAAVDFILQAPDNVAATITPHHLLLNLNDLLAEGIRPHYYCKPIVKQLDDQSALIKAATSGNPKFFLGTDSAPHSLAQKECHVGCAGIYSAHAAIELYAEVFEQHQALDKLENFSSCFGAQFYQLPLNQEKLTLVKKPWSVPHTLTFGSETLVPFFAGKTLNWQLKNET